jgi:5-methylcytosine-specific restriction endonuclease McrA
MPYLRKPIKRLRVASKTAVCGTRSAYNRHLRNKEKACELCLQAGRDYSKILRNKHKDKIAIQKKKYQQDNKEKINAYHRARWSKIPDEIRLKKKMDYRVANIERYREVNRQSERKRRAAKKNSSHVFYTEKEVLEIYGNVCYLCNREIDLFASRKIGYENWQNGLHIDHLIPLNKNGSDSIDNVRPTHGLCNVKKHDKDFVYGLAN